MTRQRPKPPRTLLPVAVWLIAALLLASCAPAAAPTAMPEPATATLPAPATATTVVMAPTDTAAPAETAAPTPAPVATSRGPNLEATDPATVRLDSGSLQLVEFFRFT